MKNLKLIGLVTISLGLLVSLSVLGRYRSPTAKNLARLGIEIRTNSTEKVLYLPVGLRPDNTAVAYVPVDNGGDISAVRVTPVMEDGIVKLDISGVTGDYRAGNCEELKKVSTRLLGAHNVTKDATVTVQDNLSNAPWRVSVRAVDLRPPLVLGGQKSPRSPKVNGFQDFELEGGGPCGCATCGTQNPLHCCPARGQCMGCSNCGQVCCPAG